jgi:60 kDa SS-A/Ro ribonucleoprotein
MRTNVRPTYPSVVTHEGAPAIQLSALKELRRSTLSALLFEDLFYESGSDHAQRVAALVQRVEPHEVAALAVEARGRMHLRHMPLFLTRELARRTGCGTLVAHTLEQVVQRPDELAEYLAIYWRGQKDADKEPLSAGSKRGLARAFAKFGPYALAKYDRDGAVKLRDVLRLVHAKPASPDQAALWKMVRDRTLPTPDTWEVELSAGKDKKATFERLLREEKLGGLAFLRNLRNMIEAQVDPDLVRARFAGNFDRVLPFRFLSAARHAPAFGRWISDALLRAIDGMPKLQGRTAVVVDVSGSMNDPVSAKSEVARMDVGAGLAVLMNELCDGCRIFTFSERVVEVANYRGLPMAEAIRQSQPNQGTYLQRALTAIFAAAPFERVVVITDEQSHDRVLEPPPGRNYMVNVASYKHGVGYGAWVHIDGWSERVVDFMRELEAER